MAEPMAALKECREQDLNVAQKGGAPHVFRVELYFEGNYVIHIELFNFFAGHLT